jgi:hypothetical protein
MKPTTLSIACLLLASCSSITAHADFEEGLDFSLYKTYALDPPPATAVGLPSYSEIQGRQVNEAIARHLEAKGYTLAEESAADLIVSFGVAGQLQQEVRSSGGSHMGGYYASGGRHRGWYGSTWYDPNVYSVAYVKGTLIIDAFDRERESLIWHGWSTVSLDVSGEPSGKGPEVIDAVMAKFPAR